MFVAGKQASAAGLSLRLDDIWFATERALVQGDSPPGYGRPDMNKIRAEWLDAVQREGAANSARAHRNPHFCEYMSSEVAHARSGQTRPLCRVDGDHLAGRWMQTCDPRLIGRPDHFAYGRALPEVKGWYDYRLCYRESATERLRAIQALSWSWRPYACALAPVRGDAFDRWLGARTIVFLGDSLIAQSYYALIWLLGEVVEEQQDLFGYAPDENVTGVARMDRCSSSVGNEGGWVSETRLRSGGKLIKVMRHYHLVAELQSTRPFWAQWVREADFILINIGHHYHGIDPKFQDYDRVVRAAIRQLDRLSRPSAQFIYRTTNVGHAACESATRPLRSRREAWEQLTEDRDIFAWVPPKGGVGMFKDKYSWRGPPLFETSWARFAREAPSVAARFSVLNVSFLDARADGHVAASMRYSALTGQWGARWKTEFPLDCLHYCYPGPADFWALALSNFLQNNERFALSARSRRRRQPKTASR
jgi:hypothetical protein